MVATESDNVPNKAASTDAGARLAPGQVIDERYEIIEFLGSGGMCMVYKARQLQLGKIVALKILQPRRITDENAVQRFQREAVAVSSLDHPNIVSVSGFGLWNSQPYMVAELVDGVSLAELLHQQGHLGKVRALTIFNQILDALSHAHERGIVHRDLKPSNVMIAADDFVKLVDFGIAKVLPESGKEMQKLTQTEDIFGTLLYMSPEQCLGHPVDARADIYSMGCLMYEVLTGKPPLQAETAFALMHKQLTEEPPDAVLLDRELAPIVMQCLEKDPGKRPKSAAALKELLASPPAVTLPLAYKALKKRRRNVRSLLPGLVVVALVVMAALGWMVSRQVGLAVEPAPKDPIDENAPRMLDEAVHVMYTEHERSMKLFDEIINRTDYSSAEVRLEAIRFRLADAMARHDWQLCTILLDRYKQIIDADFRGSLELLIRYQDFNLEVAHAKNDGPGEKIWIRKNLALLEPRRNAPVEHFKDEAAMLVRTYECRAGVAEDSHDYESAEKDLRRAFAVLDVPGIAKSPLYTYGEAGDELVRFLVQQHREKEAHALLQHMEIAKKNWDVDNPSYPNECLTWANEYSSVGDHKMAIYWVTQAIGRRPAKLSDFLEFRANQYETLGDHLRAEHDRSEARKRLQTK